MTQPVQSMQSHQAMQPQQIPMVATQNGNNQNNRNVGAMWANSTGKDGFFTFTFWICPLLLYVGEIQYSV